MLLEDDGGLLFSRLPLGVVTVCRGVSVASLDAEFCDRVSDLPLIPPLSPAFSKPGRGGGGRGGRLGVALEASGTGDVLVDDSGDVERDVVVADSGKEDEDDVPRRPKARLFPRVRFNRRPKVSEDLGGLSDAEALSSSTRMDTSRLAYGTGVDQGPPSKSSSPEGVEVNPAPSVVKVAMEDAVF